MQKKLPSLLLAGFLTLSPALFSQPVIELVSHATGFTRPVDIAHCGDSRLFIVEQRGYIWVLDSLGNRLPDPFLNIDPRVRSTGNEQGLLGLAFPPDYAQSGLFYVYYTRETDGDTRVSRFSVKPDNPNQADPDSEEILLTQDQPFNNHNGGCLKFGPDGYLYISLGDGGSGGDPQNNGQTKNTFLGKILRIDVNSSSPGLPYGIPADNPFVNDPAFQPEIWAWGLRNPWRFSFDRLTGDLWIGDVGQVTREEIDFEPAGSGGGRNYGWRCYEGTFPHITSNCQPAASYTGPIFDYDNNSVGCSVTGGFIYRGSQYADLYGVYLFTDYCSGRWWAVRQQPDGSFDTKQIADLSNNQYCTLGEDRDGELYVAALAQGTIYRITEVCSGFNISGTVTNATCYGTLNGTIFLNVSGGEAPFVFQWSNGFTESSIVYLNPGTYSVQVQDARGCLRTDTFEVEADTLLPVPEVSAVYWSAPLANPALLCAGDTVLLEATLATTGFGYQWYRDDDLIAGATQQMLAVQSPGAYSVVHTGFPCSSPPSMVREVALAPELPAPVVQVVGLPVLCGDDSTMLTTALPPTGFSIQWFRDGMPVAGAIAPQLLVKTAGSYTVQYQRAGCDYPHSSPVLISQNSAPMISQNGDILSISGQFISIQWQVFNYNTQLWDNIPGATDTVFSNGMEGLFTVLVTDLSGCIFQAGPVGIAATRLPVSVLDFQLAPNPTSGIVQLKLELRRSERITLLLTDMQQRRLFTKTISGQRIGEEIDLSMLPGGTYYLTVQLESGSFVRPLLRN